MIFFTHIRLVVHVLACMHAIAHIKWIRLYGIKTWNEKNKKEHLQWQSEKHTVYSWTNIPILLLAKAKKAEEVLISSKMPRNVSGCTHHKNIILYQELYHVMLIFIIVIFSIAEKVNRVKIQYLTLLYVNICWWLLCWYFIWWMLIIWAAVEYIKKGSFASRITTHHLVRISLYYCWSVFFCV